MALFAGTLHERITELEAALAAKDEAIATLEAKVAFKAEEIGLLAHRYVREQDEYMAEHAAQLEELGADYDGRLLALKAEHETQVHNYQGQLLQANIDARKWQRLRDGWKWHSGGKVEIDGDVYKLYEARTDLATANFRLPIPEGELFP